MSTFDDPFDADRELRRSGCVCGRHASAAEHASAERALSCEPVAPAPSDEERYEGVVASAVMRAVFPKDVARRAFLRSVGASTALAALSQFFPIKMAAEVFAQAGVPEKKDLKVGFIPITCATPIIMAAPLGFYAKQGLNVEVVKTAGWAVIRDKTINKEYDAAHMLAPMPIAISLGLGANAIPFTVPAIENINGQGITLAMKHKDKRDPKDWKGMKFAIPFDYSMHNYLLRYFLAEHGLDPDTDVQLRSVPPPEMVANLRADNIDGFLAPDNVCQRAVYDGVGFLHILSKEIWDGHPCCSFAASKEFITGSPNSFAALTRAIVDATGYASKAENRKQIAEAIAPANYLNQPVTVVEQMATWPESGEPQAQATMFRHSGNRVSAALRFPDLAQALAFAQTYVLLAASALAYISRLSRKVPSIPTEPNRMPPSAGPKVLRLPTMPPTEMPPKLTP